MIPSPTQSQVLVVLRAFLIDILPANVPVILSQVNRVPEPADSDFVLMTPIGRPRIETNVDTYNDCQFTGSISLAVLTVSAVRFGSLVQGNTVFGPNVASNTLIGTQISGTAGGIGTYNVSISQTIVSETMAAGIQNLLQPINLMVQLDVHGPNSADAAQTISTLFRDEYAYDFMAALDKRVSPLLADDPRQVPFVNDQNQWETRWVITAQLQADQTITVPQEFADEIEATLIPADIFYPAV